MNATIQTTHVFCFAALAVIQRKQGTQGVETTEFLPEEFDCNARDKTVEIEDASSECMTRIWVEDQAIVDIVVVVILEDSVLEDVRADKAHELVDCPDYLGKCHGVGGTESRP